MFCGGSGVNGEPGPEHSCRSLTDTVLVQTRMLSAQVHYRLYYWQPLHKRTISSSSPFLLPETGPLGFNRQKLLEPSKQKDNHWGENQGWGGPTGICSKWMQVSLSSRGWVCIRPQLRPGHGEGRVLPKMGDGGTSVSLQVTRVGEGLRGAKGQALPSPGTLPGGREETEIIRVFSWKSAFIRNQRPRILHHLNGLLPEN